jgi:hypothetical protein
MVVVVTDTGMIARKPVLSTIVICVVPAATALTVNGLLPLEGDITATFVSLEIAK